MVAVQDGKVAQVDVIANVPHQLKEAFFKHANLPLNLGRSDHPQGKAIGIGSCGDSIEVHLAIVDHRIDAIRHTPKGCIYTTALPGPKDTACCGSAPGQAAGCAGPGSCRGKTF